MFLGFPGGSAGTESACIVGDLGLISGLGGSPGEGKGYPLQYSELENSMDCIVHRVAKSWTKLRDFTFTFSLTFCDIESLVFFKKIYKHASWAPLVLLLPICLEWLLFPQIRGSSTLSFLFIWFGFSSVETLNFQYKFEKTLYIKKNSQQNKVITKDENYKILELETLSSFNSSNQH